MSDEIRPRIISPYSSEIPNRYAHDYTPAPEHTPEPTPSVSVAVSSARYNSDMPLHIGADNEN